MSRISSLAAVAVTGAVLVTGSTLAASAHTVAHTTARPAGKPVTITFTAKQTGTVVQSKNGFALSDTDVQGTKKIGADLLSCKEGASSSVCSLSFATQGGMIYGHLTLSDQTGALTGKVTGGTGPYVHATGTIKGQAMSRSAVKVTLTYTK